jgi:hypothetical protein
MFMYNSIPASYVRSSEQRSIISFVYSVTNYFYYVNNVKSFYLSLLTSRLFRETFIKALINLLPRHLRQRFELSQTNFPIMTVTKIKRGDPPQDAVRRVW